MSTARLAGNKKMAGNKKISLVHLKELLKLYMKLSYRLFISCLVFKIFRLKNVSCLPSERGDANFLS